MNTEELNTYLETYAINTKTQDEYNELMDYLNDMGFKWDSGMSPREENRFRYYQEETTILRLLSREYGFGYMDTSCNYHTVVPFQEFKKVHMEDNTMEKEKIEVGDTVKLRHDLTVSDFIGNEAMFVFFRRYLYNEFVIEREDSDFYELTTESGVYSKKWFELVEKGNKYPKLTEHEIIQLETVFKMSNLNSYIARDVDGEVSIFSEKPQKNGNDFFIGDLQGTLSEPFENDEKENCFESLGNNVYLIIDLLDNQ